MENTVGKLRQKVAARMVRTVVIVIFHMESVSGDLGFFVRKIVITTRSFLRNRN